MPVLTTVIDDKSPLIVYDNTWLPGTSWDDNLASNYYLGTFTTNNVTDGSVTFSFNGTAIWIYGANRPNHGNYVVEIDGANYANLNGAGNNLFQQSLFNTSSLSQGSHTAKLTNTATGNLFVDIDIIAWQSKVGNTSDQLVSEIVQDTDTRFQYQEPAWTTTSSTIDINLALFNNGSGHVTNIYDASVIFTFTGMSEAMSIFGLSGPANGQYSVQLDGGQTQTYNATNAYPTNYGVMIYYADNLGSGSHQIVLTNLPATSGQSLAIDYAQLWTTNSSNPTNTNTSSLTSGSNNSTNGLGSGAIAGIVVAVAVAVLSAGAAILFYRRWKAAMAAPPDLYRIYTPQHDSPESGTAAPTAISSSRETRITGGLLQNSNSNPTFSGRAANDRYYDGVLQVASGSRDSRSIIDTASSPTQSPIDESLGRRPLPEAPGGGMSLADEFPKLVGSPPRQVAAERGSIAPSDAPPPNYSQATGHA